MHSRISTNIIMLLVCNNILVLINCTRAVARGRNRVMVLTAYCRIVLSCWLRWLVTKHHYLESWLFFRRISRRSETLAEGLQRKLVAWRTWCKDSMSDVATLWRYPGLRTDSTYCRLMYRFLTQLRLELYHCRLRMLIALAIIILIMVVLKARKVHQVSWNLIAWMRLSD